MKKIDHDAFGRSIRGFFDKAREQIAAMPPSSGQRSMLIASNEEAAEVLVAHGRWLGNAIESNGNEDEGIVLGAVVNLLGNMIVNSAFTDNDDVTFDEAAARRLDTIMASLPGIVAKGVLAASGKPAPSTKVFSSFKVPRKDVGDA